MFNSWSLFALCLVFALPEVQLTSKQVQRYSSSALENPVGFRRTIKGREVSAILTPQCKCEGLTVDESGTHCLGPNKEVRECTNQNEWDEFYGANPGLKPKPSRKKNRFALEECWDSFKSLIAKFHYKL